MSSLIGILSLLSALAATSYALSCTQCISNETTCSGPSITCPSGNQCGSTYTESTIAGVKSTSLTRSCALSSKCGLNGSVTLQQGHMRISTSCCNTDNCTLNLPTYATTSSTPNGLVCRSCISAVSTSCNTDDTVQCTGEENMCLLMKTHVSGSVSASTAFRGCASKSICDIGRESASINEMIRYVNYTCTSGGLSVHNIVLAPAIVCLLLLKLFF
ncbi:phospholipase A2 inhibitor and Ly6/PLAUR domain-containing protein-like [Bufo bufo]|uniref:phospholipase A2 inhibitor and Ly6/PLAUR domain-containing protein-like n=1 Tax=Bufo bufo TaxID=8384 RepID=UPI001ABDC720|nr:phospholipase A2 inhibitor and Ly6/PLAUR domain-containing protein-like [Bufo bufo]